MVIGGTGMLRETSALLARRSDSLTSIARTEKSLAALDEAVSKTGCHHLAIAQDYNRILQIQSVVREAVHEAGPVELLVMWIHDEEGPVPQAICDAAAEAGHPIRIVHVVGSAAAGPERSIEALSAKFSVYPDVTYQQVVLGFHRDSDDSRWLTDEEISSGVVTAIERETSPYVVGQIRPWRLRP